MKKLAVILIIISLTWWGCQKPYNPLPITVGSNYLVVEGTINAGGDSTTIRLSRTVSLSSKSTAVKPELGASIAVVSSTGSSYPLMESNNGYYRAQALNLSPSNQYGLKIMTSNGEAYKSDLVPVKNSPPIDSAYYRVQGTDIHIYSDTHDPSNSTKYYRWDFNETYTFHVPYQSLEYVSTTPVDTILERSPSQYVYECWRSDTSTTILLNSTVALSKDIITKNPITLVPISSEKVASRYSILLKQYALTTDAFNYWQNLKRNTEQLGGIFDPQPSEIVGNIHCITKPSEPVIGYISAGIPAQKRIYINNRDLPPALADNPYANCVIDTDLYKYLAGTNFYVNQVEEYIYGGYHTPIYPIVMTPAGTILGYTASTKFCADCTLRGTNIQPSFWTNE